MATVRRIRTVFTGVAGSPWYVNLHFTSAGANTPQDQVQAVIDFWTGMASRMDGRSTARVDGDVAEIDLDSGAQTGISSGTGGAVAGGSNDDPLPPATQMLVRLSTGAYAKGRQIQGRIFIPGPTNYCNNAGVLTASTVTQINTQALALITAGLCVYSKTNKSVSTVSTATAWSEFAVMRSRRD
uniref:Uncharacterized protein n=1 Tax=uncultured prokaryote TaxID=198431 RepID=A0A0H5Q2Q3_9ZZZZ|nr:hypothetical protein [uncultured prokaryote]